jgi:hypothetical protein
MTSLMVIPSALENSAASLGAGRMSGYRTIRVNLAMASAGTQARPRLAILSGRVLPTVGFAAWPGALGLDGRWPDAGAPDRAGVVSAALNRMLRARAATANATAIRVTAR